MAKVIIYLREHEVAALNSLAEREYRAPRVQAALIIRNELQRLGLIAPRAPEGDPEGGEETAASLAPGGSPMVGKATGNEG